MGSEAIASQQIEKRPNSRWTRQVEPKSYTEGEIEILKDDKTERPLSRRGIANDITEYNKIFPASSNRITSGRPLTGSISSKKTNSLRLNTMNPSSAITRLNTGISTFDRPITQQGMTGIRPGTTKSSTMNRQIQDKRYYGGLVQLKIRELSQEIASMTQEIDMQNKEKATFSHYDRNAKDLAAELTKLQGTLGDYNIVVDKMASNTNKSFIEQETSSISQENARLLSDIEKLFEKRCESEKLLRTVERDIEEERQNANVLINSMEPATKEKYTRLEEQKKKLENLIDQSQQELDRLSDTRSRLEEQIMFSQVKQEAAKLYIKIATVEDKRDTLRNEEMNKMSSDEMRENLSQKIKQDNLDVTAAERQLADVKRRAAEAEEEVEQLETQLGNNQSEKHEKYKELRKREEVMEQFMLTFEQNRLKDQEKIKEMEQSIVKLLEKISYDVANHINVATSEEIISPKENHDHSFEALRKDHNKLQDMLAKMEVLESKLKTEINDLQENVNKKENELRTLEDLDGFKERNGQLREHLLKEKADLLVQKPNSSQELKQVHEEYTAIKEKLSKNNTFVQINVLEGKLDTLRKQNKSIEDTLYEHRRLVDFVPLKSRACSLIEQYNNILKDKVKLTY